MSREPDGCIRQDDAVPVGRQLGFDVRRVGGVDPVDHVADRLDGRAERDADRAAAADGDGEVRARAGHADAAAVVDAGQRGGPAKEVDVLPGDRRRAPVGIDREPEVLRGVAVAEVLDRQRLRRRAGLVGEDKLVALDRCANADIERRVDLLDDVVDGHRGGRVDDGGVAGAVGDPEQPAADAGSAVELRQRRLTRQLAAAHLDGDRAGTDGRGIEITEAATDKLLARDEPGDLELERPDRRTRAGGGGQHVFVAARGRRVLERRRLLEPCADELEAGEAGLEVGVRELPLVRLIDPRLEPLLGLGLQLHELVDDVRGVDPADEADAGGDATHVGFWILDLRVWIVEARVDDPPASSITNPKSKIQNARPL
jgi:hypothetical protein